MSYNPAFKLGVFFCSNKLSHGSHSREKSLKKSHFLYNNLSQMTSLKDVWIWTSSTWMLMEVLHSLYRWRLLWHWVLPVSNPILSFLISKCYAHAKKRVPGLPSITSHWELLSVNTSWQLIKDREVFWPNTIDLNCYHWISSDNNWFLMVSIHLDWLVSVIIVVRFW